MSSTIKILSKGWLPGIAGAVLLSLTACSSSRPYYDTDGIYNNRPVVVNDTNENSAYYEQYFKEKGQDAQEYFTDIENYSSYSSGKNYGGWGENTSNTNIYMYNDPNWGWGAPWGWNGGWGYGGYFGWGWDFGWGWGSPWGWYGGWYGGWGSPWGWGWNNGWGYPYYNNRYVSHSRNVRPMGRTVYSNNRGLSTRGVYTNNRTNTRVVPRKTFSQPTGRIITNEANRSRFNNDRNTQNIWQNDRSLNRRKNDTFNNSRSTINRGSNNRSISTPRMSTGSSRGFGGGSAPMRSSGRR